MNSKDLQCVNALLSANSSGAEMRSDIMKANVDLEDGDTLHAKGYQTQADSLIQQGID